jgi:hypothetical protein
MPTWNVLPDCNEHEVPRSITQGMRESDPRVVGNFLICFCFCSHNRYLFRKIENLWICAEKKWMCKIVHNIKNKANLSAGTAIYRRMKSEQTKNTDESLIRSWKTHGHKSGNEGAYGPLMHRPMPSEPLLTPKSPLESKFKEWRLSSRCPSVKFL